MKSGDGTVGATLSVAIQSYSHRGRDAANMLDAPLPQV